MTGDAGKVYNDSTLFVCNKETLAVLDRVLSVDGVGNMSVDDKGTDSLRRRTGRDGGWGSQDGERMK